MRQVVPRPEWRAFTHFSRGRKGQAGHRPVVTSLRASIAFQPTTHPASPSPSTHLLAVKDSARANNLDLSYRSELGSKSHLLWPNPFLASCNPLPPQSNDSPPQTSHLVTHCPHLLPQSLEPGLLHLRICAPSRSRTATGLFRRGIRSRGPRGSPGA